MCLSSVVPVELEVLYPLGLSVSHMRVRCHLG